MNINRRSFALGGAALFLPGLAAAQQGWPQKPVRLIVPFSAGGPSDVLARAFARNFSDAIGQPVVVENRAGAGGAIGIDAAAKAAPDGYTLGFAHTGTTAINPHVMAKHPYDPLADLTPITPIVSYANVLVVNADIPVRTVADFVAWAKANPRQASFASGGTGASNHLAGELLKVLTGAPLTHIPYKGSGPAMTDVVGGTVPAMFDIPVTLLPHVRSGRIRPLAILSPRRSSVLPDVPTLREAGYPGFEEAGSDLWFGLVGPAGLPQALLERMHAETAAVLRRPEMLESIKTMGYEPWVMSPQEFRAFIRNDHSKWGKVVKAAGLKQE
ncbi:Bug family tripartite tricarboxylate transporter substrate binding protein [Hydrogenophaga intermedia]|uniref:Bug family tripartite tricarboxylate transporter substrate binding protein n=1 Tax=Hydrogenophaga intermedia TaxID=65786 RepID=UPI00204442A7|nr:tripartite tricarboxylate transporter substrate binding protein [Hydrogenophaga intermedia]MCM3562779.1 tripartite tricarboxylate transporter substrate binding protein [Hydrogenophaga intermedia]